MKINTKGFAVIELGLVVIAVAMIGFVIFRVVSVDRSSKTTQEDSLIIDEEQLLLAQQEAEAQRLAAEEAENEAEASEPEPAEKEVSQSTAPTTPKPAPEQNQGPQPNYDLYNSPQEEFAYGETVAYVVNKSGAQVAAAEEYYSTNYVKTLPFGAKVVASRQDGEGPSSMTIVYNGTQYTANPADFRTTYPYN
ncbi:TPA: hypothetical protein EYO12_00810 [Candidatus Saccharibacteria bacterium]|nr:hypothetical protein [Candidatus Saccharibacteria bacterium]HIO87258.1 hypothetical protein [Candidatus Saccharibacteria bacterium]